MAHDADLKELNSLGLHTLGAVNYHDRGISRHKGYSKYPPEKSLMARRIQNVDAESVMN